MYILYLYFPAVMELIPILTALVIISIWVYIFSFRVFVFPLELQYWLTSFFFILNSFIIFAAETESHEGKRKVESLWPIFRIHHQRSRYIYDLFYRRKAISRGKENFFFIVLSFLLFTLFLSMFFSFFLFLQHSVFFHSFTKRNEK